MVSAIVLAAGSSQRMQGINKLLLPYNGTTIISSVVQNILGAGIKDILIVTGYEEDKIQKALQNFPVRLVHNQMHKNGMTGSVQTGVIASKGHGYMICLGDMVSITSAEYAFLKNSFTGILKKDDQCICIPVYNDQKGNPVLFSAFYREAILQHKEMDGCKQIVQSNKEHVYSIAMPLKNVLKDIDFYSDYQEEILSNRK